MKKIFKYQFGIEDKVEIEMPEGAQILSCQMQGPEQFAQNTPVIKPVCLWALVDPEAKTVKRTLFVRGTGHPAEGLELLPFISTVQLAGGQLIYHIFDGGEE